MAKLESMLITPAKNKGLSVSHRYAPKAEVSRGRSGGGMAMITPRTEEYTFGPDQHAEALQHIQKHLGMGADRARQNENEMGGEE